MNTLGRNWLSWELNSSGFVDKFGTVQHVFPCFPVKWLAWLKETVSAVCLARWALQYDSVIITEFRDVDFPDCKDRWVLERHQTPRLGHRQECVLPTYDNLRLPDSISFLKKNEKWYIRFVIMCVWWCVGSITVFLLNLDFLKVGKIPTWWYLVGEFWKTCTPSRNRRDLLVLTHTILATYLPTRVQFSIWFGIIILTLVINK